LTYTLIPFAGLCRNLDAALRHGRRRRRLLCRALGRRTILRRRGVRLRRRERDSGHFGTLEIRVEVDENLQALLVDVPPRARPAVLVPHPREQRTIAGAGADTPARLGPQHQPAARRELVGHVDVSRIAQVDAREDVHPHRRPEPGALAPDQRVRVRLELRNLCVRRAVLQHVAAAFVEAQPQFQSLG
jgi:hypothetical protein